MYSTESKSTASLLLLYFYVYGKWSERDESLVLLIQSYIVNSYYAASNVLNQFLFYTYFDISRDKIHIYFQSKFVLEKSPCAPWIKPVNKRELIVWNYLNSEVINQTEILRV